MPEIIFYQENGNFVLKISGKIEKINRKKAIIHFSVQI